MIIRDATVADMAAVARIYAHYVETGVITFDEAPPTTADWERRLDDLRARGLPFLAAEVKPEGVVGYAYAGPWRPKPAYRHTVEDSVYCAPGWTGRGIGPALLRALLTGCGQAGARQVVAVIADTGSDASVTLHCRLGFTHAGRLSGVGHKHGRWVDTVLMQRSLEARAEDDLDRIVTAHQPRAARAHLAAELIRSTTNARWVGIYTVGDEMVSNEAWSGPSAPAHPTFPARDGLTAHAIRARAVTVSNDVASDPRYLANQHDSGSELIIPVLAERRVVGTLDVESPQIGAFTGATIEQYETLAGALRPLWQ